MADNMESNLSRGAQAVAQARANADFSDEDSVSMNDTANKGSGGEQEPTDALTRLRRQKRLAMNRESARARRKRKKCLIETLEEHVAELTQKNRRYQIATESLTAKVNKLESDLGVARSTITYLSTQSQSQPRSDMLSRMTAAELGLSGVSASGSSPASRQNGFQNRLQGLSHSQLGAGSAYGQSAFLDDHRLRQHALDLQIAQASRESNLGSVLGRYAVSQQDLGLNAYGASAAPGLQRPTINTNTLALPLETAGDMRLGLPNIAAGMQGAGLSDALLPNQSRSAATSQLLSDYLKHGDSKYASKGEKKQSPW